MKFKGEGIKFDEEGETVTFKLKKPITSKKDLVTEITLRTEYVAGDLVAIGRGEKNNDVDGLLHLAAELSQVSADQTGYSVSFIRRLKRQDTQTLLSILGEIMKPDAPEEDDGESEQGAEKKPALGAM